MWKGELVFISEAPIGELVSIAELETGDHVVRFCGLDIGLLDAAAPNLSGINAGPKMSTIRAVELDLLSVWTVPSPGAHEGVCVDPRVGAGRGWATSTTKIKRNWIPVGTGCRLAAVAGTE
jgi:hypothetical protein